ncbi:MAG: lysylphosphatidylglycerol synthase transmembrane domain-containing protein [Bdellovibrionota bacterium]
MKKTLGNAAKILLAIGLIAWLVAKGMFDVSAIQKVLTPLNVIIFILLGTTSTFLASERSRLLLAHQVATYSRFQIFKLSIMGLFFNFAMPGGVGGDVVKGVYLVKNNSHQRGTALLALLLDRIIGLYCMVFLAVAVMLADLEHVLQTPQLQMIFVFMNAVFAALTIGAAICFNTKTSKLLHGTLNRIPILNHPKLHKLIDALYDYGQNPLLLAKACGLSILAQSLAIVLFYVVARTLAPDVPLNLCFIVGPIGFIVTALPITPGGVGVGQAAFFYLFELYVKGSGSVGTTGITLHQAIQLLLGVWGAYYFVRSEKHLIWTLPKDV